GQRRSSNEARQVRDGERGKEEIMLQPRYDDYDHGITAIDTDYVRPYLDASHLIVRDGRAAFVDTGVNSSVPHLLAVLERKGIAPDQVDYVLVTHVHLDHAGGAGQLMQALPNARLVVHPRGARHMIDPQRLIEGSRSGERRVGKERRGRREPWEG